jgi:putative nucleotidyltransferase with HDIG domain
MRERLSAHAASNRAYLALVITGGVLAVVTSVHQLALSGDALPWLTLAAFTILSGFATLRLPNVPVAFSISDAFTFTAAVFFGPTAGAVAVALDSLVISLRLARRKFSLRQLLFNATAPALAMWTAAHAFVALAGRPVGPLGGPWMSLDLFFVALFVFTGLYFLFNTGAIAIAIAFDQRTAPFAIWRRHFLPLWLTYFGGAIVAALLFVLGKSGVADPIVLVLIVPIPLILYAAFKNAVGRLGDQFEHLGQVNRMYLSTIEALTTAINAKDGVTHDHIRRVQSYAVGLARVLGINDEATIKALEAAALLHDTGKLAVPEHILNKPGKLTPAEFEKMKLHVDVGADILSTIDFPYPVVPIVRCHHENWDGSGYPRGIAGEDIPIGARILSVVDCFDALTSDRPYRRALSDESAFEILKARRGTMYDPVIVDTFMRVHKDLVLPQQAPAHHEDALARITQAATPLKVPTIGQPQELPAANSDNMLSIFSLARLATERASAGDVATLAATLVRNLVPGCDVRVLRPYRGRAGDDARRRVADRGPARDADSRERAPERVGGGPPAHDRQLGRRARPVRPGPAAAVAHVPQHAAPRRRHARRRADALRGVPRRVHRRTGTRDADARSTPGPPRPPHVCGSLGRSTRDADAASRHRGRTPSHRRQAIGVTLWPTR